MAAAAMSSVAKQALKFERKLVISEMRHLDAVKPLAAELGPWWAQTENNARHFFAGQNSVAAVPSVAEEGSTCALDDAADFIRARLFCEYLSAKVSREDARSRCDASPDAQENQPQQQQQRQHGLHQLQPRSLSRSTPSLERWRVAAASGAAARRMICCASPTHGDLTVPAPDVHTAALGELVGGVGALLSCDSLLAFSLR